MILLKKILVSEFFFKFNNYFFSTGTPTANKLDDGIPVTHFRASNTGIQNGTLKLQTTSVIVCRQQIFRDFK